MMNACRPLVTVVALALSVLCALASNGQENASSVAVKPAVKDFRGLPLGFETNQGQADPAVRFLARGAGYGIYLSEREAALVIAPSRHNQRVNDLPLREDRTPPEVVRMKLAGGRQDAQPEGLGRLTGVVNYFIGSDPSKWRTGVPTYPKAR